VTEVPALERVQRAFRPADHPRERKGRLGGSSRSHHAERQRQTRAPRHDMVDGHRVSGHPIAADGADQEFARLGHAEQAQRERTGARRGHQPGQAGPADHDHQAPRCTGYQGIDLVGIPRVVQHDQHPPAGQHTAVQRGLRVEARRYLGG
jgi:hypothetical protein